MAEAAQRLLDAVGVELDGEGEQRLEESIEIGVRVEPFITNIATNTLAFDKPVLLVSSTRCQTSIASSCMAAHHHSSG